MYNILINLQEGYDDFDNIETQNILLNIMLNGQYIADMALDINYN